MTIMTDNSAPQKVLFLSPPFHGHARPLWELANRLNQLDHFDCLFLDSFTEDLTYPGDAPIYKIKTNFNDELLSSTQKSANLDYLKVVTETLASYFKKLPPFLNQLMEDYQPDILIVDYFFGYGAVLAQQFNKPFIVAYSSPDLFFIDQSGTNIPARMEIMMEQRKYAAYQEIMADVCDGELNSFSLSPYGNFCFTPDIIKQRNPSAFLAEGVTDQATHWHQFHSFFDDQYYPLQCINHATPVVNADQDDAALVSALSNPGKVSILISFGTVWLRQLDDKKTEQAFVSILKGLLIAANDSRFTILYSGDIRFLEAAQAGVELQSQVIQKDFINQNYLVQFADIFAFHGGYNSFCEAMAGQARMLIFPKAFDQGRIADLASALGVGERVPFTNSTPKLIAEKLHQLIDNKSYLENLAQHHDDFKHPLDIEKASVAISEVIDAFNA